MNKEGKLLGVDFGKSKVGLAITDSGRSMVFRRGIIKNYKSLDNLFKQISDIIKKEGVVGVVWGVPFGIDGEMTPQAENVMKIGLKLNQFLKDDVVVFEDESFSTFEANNHIAGLEPGKIVNSDDDMAAFLILSGFLGRVGDASKKGDDNI